eukprot:TRINITY_DN3414_c0_g1_i1.p1 TRINITY_DN3414_c0_g1~~TRINITY_DN3414_c0_g1_i1.p1  ORF type:complete len:239 (-),score=30.47 TRINITY_DN3414_c0_g1_i1:698-1414(-)
MQADSKSKAPKLKFVDSPKEKSRQAKILSYSTPGPGQYDIVHDPTPEKAKNSYNSISFGYHGITRSKPAPPFNIPGPGTYSQPKHSKVPSYSFGERCGSPLAESLLKGRRQLMQREKCQSELMGQVSCLAQAPGVKISSPPKPKRVEEKQVGPGDYTIPEERIENDFTMAGRRRYSRYETETPGPASYFVEKSRRYLYSSLQKSFGGLENRGSKKDLHDSPGPGAYNPQDSHNVCTYK